MPRNRIKGGRYTKCGIRLDCLNMAQLSNLLGFPVGHRWLKKKARCDDCAESRKVVRVRFPDRVPFEESLTLCRECMIKRLEETDIPETELF